MKNQIKLLLTAGLIAAAPLIHAQAGAAASAPVAPPSPAKQALINQVLDLQKSGVEAMAYGIVQRPLQQLALAARQALQQQVPADKREAAAQAVQTDLKNFADTNGKMLADQAVKLQPAVVGPLLNAQFSEDELRQLVNFLQSPTSRKYMQLGGEVQNAMAQKLLAEQGQTLETRRQALEQAVVKDLGLTPPPAGASKPAAKAAAPAKK
ncbi:MAG: DUF2059 domain-containing protein [Paucibacter sp.]|nr:DUF2059 domain-containing protein [Roseateles sp.]